MAASGRLRNFIARSALKIIGHPRDPALADWLGRPDDDTGIDITPNNARECPEVDACIGLKEDTLATLPLDFFERTGPDTRERREDHALHVLLHDRPNDWQSSAEWRQMMEGNRQTHGNAYSRIIWGGTAPQELLPVHPDYMRPFFAPNNTVAYHWSPPDGPSRILLQHEVLHVRDTPARRINLCEGESKVLRHTATIGRAVATSKYMARFFKNGGVPKIVLELPPGSTQQQADDAREMWLGRHAARENWQKPAVTHSGFGVKPLGMSNTDAELIDAYKLCVAQLARIWGVPLHLIGEMQNQPVGVGSGIEQQSIGFVVYYTRPDLVVWEQALNRALMSTEMGRRFYFEFNVDGLLRGDFKTRMEGFALMVQWGLASPNEIRKMMNLPPVAGGDERLHPLNMAPASRIMDVLMRNDGKAQTRQMTPDDITRVLAAIVRIANGNAELEKTA